MRSGARVAALVALISAAALVACGPAGDQAVSPSATEAVASPAPALGTAAWPEPSDAPFPADTAAKLTAELTSWVDKGFLPGVTAAVVSPQGVWSAAAGVDGRGAPLQPSSGMALASITKTFTAAEVMLLAERGTLDLDAEASTYLDRHQVANGVTIRQLLAHRSSIPEVEGEPYATLFTALDTRWSPEQVLAPVPKPTTPAGTSFRYDNINYVLLGLVIEAVTGGDTATAFTRDLWQPLGLDRLAYQDQQTLAPPLASAGTDEELPEGTPDQPYLPSRSLASAFGASGGVAGDAESTARWGYDLYGARLLTPESVAQMTDFDDGDGYGLGTLDFTSGKQSRSNIEGVGHDGRLPGYRTVLAVIPSHQLAIAILSPSTVETVPYVKWLVKAGLLTGGTPTPTP